MRLLLLISFLFSPIVSSAMNSPGHALCDQVGGKTDDDPDLCDIEGGRIGVWILLRATSGDPKDAEQAVKAFFRDPSENRPKDGSPAAYCKAQNGSFDLRKGNSGSFIAYCSFPDGSYIDAMTLLRGPSKYSKLAKLLKSKIQIDSRRLDDDFRIDPTQLQKVPQGAAGR